MSANPFTTIKINHLIHPDDTVDNKFWYKDEPSTSHVDLYPSEYSSPSTRSSSISSSSTSTSVSSDPIHEHDHNLKHSPLSFTSPEVQIVHPPTVINIKDLEPLRLAKKKHYNRSQSDLKVHKRSGSNRPQGRPFNETLNARFLCFNSIDDLMANVLNINDHDTIRLMKQFPAASKPHKHGHQSTQKNLIKTIIQTSKELKLKNIDDTTFRSQPLEFDGINVDNLNVHAELCDIFGLKDFSFVKIIRNNKGRLVKFEILSNIDRHDIDIDYIKKFITYPRYKAKMKIYMIDSKFEQDIWFYNDLRMLLWDIENGQLYHKKVLVNNKILKE